jgi:hypothetical protein
MPKSLNGEETMATPSTDLKMTALRLVNAFVASEAQLGLDAKACNKLNLKQRVSQIVNAAQQNLLDEDLYKVVYCIYGMLPK